MSWPGTGTAELWTRLRRPFDPVGVVDAILGLSTPVSRQMVGAVLATSPEAEKLLNRMPQLVRSLAVSTTLQPLRCIGEVRGAVRWSETIAARSASPGAGGVFVCSSPVKAFDTDENRVLVAALHALRDAGQATQAVHEQSYDDAVLRQARANGARATRFLEHRTLADVGRARPSGRSIKRARSGTRRNTYLPAVAFLALANEPVSLDDVRRFCDRRTSAQHDLLIGIADGLARRNIQLPPFVTEAGGLRAGPLVYRHPRQRGSRDGAAGITVGPIVLDVPDRLGETNPFAAQAALRDRAGDRKGFVVMSEAEVGRAVELAARAITL